ncbi:class I ribonucleotide reductase maintenance protein YfaE [Lonsdalea iberica]|uniref:2Fe-2S ferredoxin n=1 Tax=Lonsdalea iberica TaxID=1082703 RepID=A0A1X3RVZ0_9GAMM|nr:class I ribonucleotide reductase maintenance protein YfaE [Lonsdalea iberica]OSN06173.1 2Fe-2S ferredoxin [Lonsdalea iberica]
MSTPTITLRTSGAQFEYSEEGDATLLEALETQRVNVEFHCRSGYCGACRMRLLKGEVSYAQTPLAFFLPGEILPCCCKPLSDVELDI